MHRPPLNIAEPQRDVGQFFGSAARLLTSTPRQGSAYPFSQRLPRASPYSTKHNYKTTPTQWTAPSIAVLTTSSGIASRYAKYYLALFLPRKSMRCRTSHWHDAAVGCSGLTRGYRTTTTTTVTTTGITTTVLAAVVVANDPTTPEMASERCVRARSPAMPASPRPKSTSSDSPPSGNHSIG